MYTWAADAYHNATHCANINASEGKVKVAKDSFEQFLLDTAAANRGGDERDLATAKAAAFREKAAQMAAGTEALEHVALAAKPNADAFVAMARAAERKIEKVHESR